MVNLEVLHENVTEKFKWGGLNEVDQPVALGFRGTISAFQQMFQLGLLKAAREYRGTEDSAAKEKYQTLGVDLLDKYFEAFPDFNFPYDSRTFVFTRFYYELGVPEKMVPVLDALIDRYGEQMYFYSSLSTSALNSGFNNEKSEWESSIPQLANLVMQTKDAELAEKLHSTLGGYVDLSQFQIQ